VISNTAKKIKALPMMKRAFEEGRKVRFAKGKLSIDDKAVPVQ